MLAGKNLCVFRGDRCLFQELDFALNRHELLLVEGRNGCGKTSLLRAIAGLLEFDSGEITWHGQPVLKQHQEFRAQLVWLAHRVGFKGDLTLLENLAYESGLRATDTDRLPAALARLDLLPLTTLPLRVLSAGQQRRVALARMLLSRAPLWMMDEPFTNLDREGQELVRDLIGEHLASGGMCVVASHQDIELDATIRRVKL